MAWLCGLTKSKNKKVPEVVRRSEKRRSTRVPSYIESSEFNPSSDLCEVEDIEIMKKIGKAKFPVFLAHSAKTGENFALKLFPIQDGQLHDYYKNEIRFAPLDHPNIIKMLHYEDMTHTPLQSTYDNSKHVSCILMEYAPYGDLFDLLKDRTSSVSEKMARTYFRQLIDGLEYLHDQGIWHLDIKPENLLIGKEGEIRIADFDLSFIKGDPEIITSGTASYRPPELKGNKCRDGAAADIYSAGIILFILKCGGSVPYIEGMLVDEKDLVDMLYNETDNFFNFHAGIQNRPKNFFDKSFKDLFRSMLDKDPTKRPTIAQIKKSKWYNGPVLKKKEFEEEFSKLITVEGIPKSII